MHRLILLIAMLAGLSACGTPSLDEAPEPIGDFRLGFVVPTVSPNLTKGPVSREATPEEWKEAARAAFEPRFKRYEGNSFYHLGVIIEGYVLAQPGIPVVLSPKSALIFSVTVIEDATQTVLTEEPHQITVLESLSAATVVGSGLVKSKEEQMKNLSENASVQVEKWLRDQPWFYDAAPASSDAETVDQVVLEDTSTSEEAAPAQ